MVIDSHWRDAHGLELTGGFRKSFAGGPIDREPADPKLWRITAPRAGTTDSLILDFPKSMDYALLQRLIEIAGVEGSITLDRNFNGAILAPLANLQNSTAIDGSVWVKSFTQSGEVHLPNFTQYTTIPAPGAASLMALGGLLIVRRRR